VGFEIASSSRPRVVTPRKDTLNMNPFKITTHQLYIFQLENYEFSRFAARMSEGLWRPRQAPRKSLVWTPKAVALFVLAVFFEFLAAGLAATSVLNGAAAWVLFAVLAVLLAYGFWLFLLAAAVFLWPLDFALKQMVIGRAAAKLRALSNIRVVGVAGSYGKTTFKNIAATILGESFKTVMTPDSVNTPVGIARWILRDVAPEAEVLVVEFGEYYPGDIQKLCRLIPPDISVITGVNEAHLERLGNLETTASTVFEAAVYAKPQAVIVVNGADELAARFAPGSAGGRRTLFYGIGKAETAWQVGNLEFMQDGSGWGFDLSYEGKSLGRFRVPFLGEYALSDLIGTALIADELGGKPEGVVRGVAKLKTVEHRLQVLPSENKILVIDDSYNGNPSGAAEAVKVLGRFLGRRRIYVTPGLVEMGKNSAAVHETLGRTLAKTADLVLLVRNSATPHIASGLLAASFPESHLRWFASAAELFAGVKTLARPGDVVLFQNDWPDNYL